MFALWSLSVSLLLSLLKITKLCVCVLNVLKFYNAASHRRPVLSTVYRHLIGPFNLVVHALQFWAILVISFHFLLSVFSIISFWSQSSEVMSFAWCSLFLNLSYFHFFIFLLHFLGSFFTFIFQLFYWICASWMLFFFFIESYSGLMDVTPFISPEDVDFFLLCATLCFFQGLICFCLFQILPYRFKTSFRCSYSLDDWRFWVCRWGLLTLCFTTGWSGWSQGHLQWCSLWRHQIEGGSNAALSYLPVHEPWSEAMRLPERRDAFFLPQNCDLLFKSDIRKASSTQRR